MASLSVRSVDAPIPSFVAGGNLAEFSGHAACVAYDLRIVNGRRDEISRGWGKLYESVFYLQMGQNLMADETKVRYVSRGC